jgi:hypothetical protein
MLANRTVGNFLFLRAIIPKKRCDLALCVLGGHFVRSGRSAGEFCRAYDELRNFLRSRSRTNQHVSADYRRFHFLRRTATVLRVLEAA